MPDDQPRGPTLVSLARAAIESPSVPAPREWGEAWLAAPGASFVTLHLDGDLRGCIGSIQARRALGDDVTHNARAAAFRDPRFPPVTPAEIPRLEVEVSVLSPRQVMQVRDEAEALAMLRPGVDGVYFEFHDLASTFLPQVWESIPVPADFLGELKRKAGLPPRFWHPDVRLSRYTVEKYP